MATEVDATITEVEPDLLALKVQGYELYHRLASLQQETARVTAALAQTEQAIAQAKASNLLAETAS